MFSWEDLKKHSYLVIDHKVYDVQAFGKSGHPGGDVILLHLGRDATDVFRSLHTDQIYEQLANFYVGDLEPTGRLEVDSFTLAMRKLDADLRQRGAFERSLWPTIPTQLGIFCLFCFSLTMLLHFGNTIVGVLLSACSLALFIQQSGWICHDFCHDVGSDNQHVNRLLRLLYGSCIQGLSPRWWKHKHNIHHACTNIYSADTDIDGYPVIAWSDHALELFSDVSDDDLVAVLAKILITHQIVLYLPLLAISRFSWSIQSLFYDFSSSTRAPYLEQFALLSHWIWLSAVTSLIPSTPLRILFLFTTISLNGHFLALVFALNHNGMQVLSKSQWDTTSQGFFEIQVRAGRDLNSGVFVDWFCGGLGHQVTHHLFPLLPRHRFGEVQREVEVLCRDHGIPYHRTGFFEGTWEVLSRLNDVANKAREILRKGGGS